jgi:hypothetical protein
MYRQLEDYMNCLYKSIKLPQKDNNIKLKKISNDDISIPTVLNIELLHQYNYNLQQLKMFAKHYKLKQSGNKNELFLRIHYFLSLSRDAVVIQKVFRGYLWRTYEACHGPAYRDRKLCVNETDFLTMEPVSEIPANQFYSFRDSDDFIYGFDIVSLFNLNKKVFYHRETRNPYNRIPLPKEVIFNMRRMIRLARTIGKSVNIIIEEEIQPVEHKTLETRCRDVFHAIDNMGHYTSVEWFTGLSLRNLRKFVRELTEIWNYRANIPLHVRRQICPPHGDPFRDLRYADLFTNSGEEEIIEQRKMVLVVLEKLVYSGTNESNKQLGAFYVLGALTLVDQNAALSMPGLYESFVYY